MSDIIADETPAWYYRANGFVARQQQGPPWGGFVPPRSGGFTFPHGGIVPTRHRTPIPGGWLSLTEGDGADSGPAADAPRESAAQRGAVNAPATPTAARDLLPPESIRRPDLAPEIPPYIRAPREDNAGNGPFNRSTWFDLGTYASRPTVTAPTPRESHWLSRWTLEDRAEKNSGLPTTYGDAERARGITVPGYMAVLHDNHTGKPEMKVTFPDGREAVYDGDTGQLITDPKYAGTYNYVNPTVPSWNPLTWPETIARGIGHGVADVLPYYIWGNPGRHAPAGGRGQ